MISNLKDTVMLRSLSRVTGWRRPILAYDKTGVYAPKSLQKCQYFDHLIPHLKLTRTGDFQISCHQSSLILFVDAFHNDNRNGF